MSMLETRICRCGNNKFYATQLCRHNVLVDSKGNYIENIGVSDAETPYGPFTCTACGALYDELEDMDAKIPTTTCLNGNLSTGDVVISVCDDYAFLVGTVIQINLLGSPEHDIETENETDDVHVNFMDTAYSKRRIREISRMLSELYGEKKTMRDCPIDDVIMAPEYLIRITDIDDDILCRLLSCEENAKLFCEGVKSALLETEETL